MNTVVSRRRIVGIPKRLLCPSCGAGRLRATDVDGNQVQLGDYLRRCQMICKNCGYSKASLEEFVGVEIDDEDAGDERQPELF